MKIPFKQTYKEESESINRLDYCRVEEPIQMTVGFLKEVLSKYTDDMKIFGRTTDRETAFPYFYIYPANVCGNKSLIIE